MARFFARIPIELVGATLRPRLFAWWMNPDKSRSVKIGNCRNKRSHRYQRYELRDQSAPTRTKPGLVLRRWTYLQVQVQRSFLKARTEHIVAIRERSELAV